MKSAFKFPPVIIQCPAEKSHSQHGFFETFAKLLAHWAVLRYDVPVEMWTKTHGRMRPRNGRAFYGGAVEGDGEPVPYKGDRGAEEEEIATAALPPRNDMRF